MKRCSQLRKLSVEHQAALSLAVRVKRAADSASADDLKPWVVQIQERWWSELLPHFQAEESKLIPALEAAGQADLVAQAIQEHRAIEDLVFDSNLPCRTRLRRFADLLREHVRFEERILFETAQTKLSQHELDLIQAGLSDAP